MQTLVEFLSKNVKELRNEVLSLIDLFRQDILDLSTNVHSNHVIQAFLTSFKTSEHPADPDLPGAQ